jgi:hypothetical protein
MSSSKVVSVTAVQWSWWDDKKWVAYDAATNLAIELAFGKGEKRIGVDKERFVDVDFADNAAIQKCLANSDAALIGVQRRFDDESRRRAVRRVVPDFFGAHLFLVLVEKSRAAVQIDWIATHGGLTAAKWKKAITAVLCSDETLADAAHRTALNTAVAANVPLLHFNVIDDVVAGQTWAAASAARALDAAFKSVLAAEAAAVAASSSSTTTASTSTKRKTPSSSAAASLSTVAASSTVKKSKTVTASASSTSSIDLRPLLQKTTVFEGVVRYSDGDDYAFELVIDSANAASGVYVGTTTWQKKLDDAETEWNITLSAAGAFEARELKANNPAAANYIAIGAVYTGMMSDKGDLLMGSVVDADGAALSPSFRLTHKANLGSLGAVSSSSASTAVAMATDDNDADDEAVPTMVLPLGGVAAASKSTFKGVVTLRLPFTLTVDGTAGKLDWALGASLGESVSIVGDRFVMRKAAKARAPSLVLPSEFEGKLSGSTVSGTVENGTFEMHALP